KLSEQGRKCFQTMNSLWEFLSFSDPNIRYVAFGSVLLTASSAIVGSFTFLNKKSLVGDAIAHAVLPGICLGFLLAGTKNPIALIVGALVTGWSSLVLVDYIATKTRIQEDTAMGLILSLFFGIGILMLTVIQKSGNALQSGLDHFLFGKAASLVGSDLITFSIVAVIRSEEHTSELQSRENVVCRLVLEKNNITNDTS